LTQDIIFNQEKAEMNTQGLFSPCRFEYLLVGYVCLYLAGLLLGKIWQSWWKGHSPSFSRWKQHKLFWSGSNNIPLPPPGWGDTQFQQPLALEGYMPLISPAQPTFKSPLLNDQLFAVQTFRMKSLC
jgi:hypothetical protein